jgi:hypothetical protein
MSPRTTKKRRRTTGQATATATNGSPTTLLAQVTELVNENQALVRENRELHTIIDRVTKAVQVTSSAPRGDRRKLQERGGRSASSRPDGHRRQRRKITDPASLEKRRAALSKARQVLAEKRAAGKASE